MAPQAYTEGGVSAVKSQVDALEISPSKNSPSGPVFSGASRSGAGGEKESPFKGEKVSRKVKKGKQNRG
jgi:hypothetical protein